MLVSLSACKPKATDDSKAKASNQVTICTACGEVEKSGKCCVKDAEKCAKCGLNKGSVGCCTIEKGSKKPVTVCTDCGEFKGGKKCCASDAKVCAKCGLNEGSPGCCKKLATDCGGCGTDSHAHSH